MHTVTRNNQFVHTVRRLCLHPILFHTVLRTKGIANRYTFYRSISDNELVNSLEISLHCPLFPETMGIVNASSIAKMKDGVILLNNSRGPLIVEQDPADALNSGKVFAAGLDVVSEEPIRADNPLLKAKNCIITPHISWAPKESRQRLMDIAVQNLFVWIGGKAQNVVNP